MEILTELTSIRTLVAKWRRAALRIALVPTMGNLHQGHIKLIQQAKILANRVVVSIFVNPLQFGPNEDFLAYPRTLKADQCMLDPVGVDVLLVPSPELFYPCGQESQTRIEVPGISNILCGASRPGHFVGVATVVCKLCNLVQPDLAFFGEKDWQQLVVIRRMVVDLNLPVEIIGVAIVREADGLAMSSRNGYLHHEERSRAPALYQALQMAAVGLKDGEKIDAVEDRVWQDLTAAGLRPDYISVRRAVDLAPVGPNDQELIILAAAHLGKVRLIDNCRVVRTPTLGLGLSVT